MTPENEDVSQAVRDFVGQLSQRTDYGTDEYLDWVGDQLDLISRKLYGESVMQYREYREKLMRDNE